MAVIHQTQLELAQDYGVGDAGKLDPVTPDSLFQACSISKAVAAVATLRLVDSGRIDLDVDVDNYLDSWNVPPNGGWQPRITLRQLLSHTAGATGPWYPGYHPDQQIPTPLDILQGEKPANTPGVRVNVLPGSRYRYAGGGYCIVQQRIVAGA